MTQSARISFLILIFTTLTGCSVIDSLNPFSSSKPKAPPAAPADKAEVTSEKDQRTDTETEGTEEIELVWKVGPDNIVAYHINYGENAGSLTHHLRVPVDQLQRFDHPQAGPSYRIALRVPISAKARFATIQAESSAGKSAPSAPMPIAAGKAQTKAKKK